jgi:uncharacterized protein (TIGR00251 family)
MIIEVTAKPGSSRVLVEKTGGNTYLVRVTKPPHDGQANEAVIEALSEHFRTAKSGIILIKGRKGRKKVFEVNV